MNGASLVCRNFEPGFMEQSNGASLVCRNILCRALWSSRMESVWYVEIFCAGLCGAVEWSQSGM